MQPLLPAQVNDDLRAAVAATVERLGEFTTAHPYTVVAPGWKPWCVALGLGRSTELVDATAEAGLSPERPVVAVGPIATALELAPRAAPLGVLAFIAPAAYRRRFWQRGRTSFLDPTRDVWLAGWSPLAVARVDIADRDATIEVVVGHARPTPEPLRGRNWRE